MIIDGQDEIYFADRDNCIFKGKLSNVLAKNPKPKLVNVHTGQNKKRVKSVVAVKV